MSAEPSNSPLSGIRVVDLTRYIPGPYCTMLLGDLGADVVKVEEPPLGDPTRAVPPPVGEESAVHAALNRNKRSIAVDVRNEEGAAVVKRLLETADVFVESNRPGVLARRGLGPTELLAANPRLVYCSITGYGQGGPLASRAGHDIDYLALSGFLGSNRDPEGRPTLPLTQVADMTGGLLATLSILAALLARERTGRGQVVDASLHEGAFALLTLPAARLLAGGSVVNELTGTHACYRVFRCKDGKHLAVGALEPKFWEALCDALDLGDLLARQWEGGKRREETLGRVAAAFAERDRDEWVKRFRGLEACVEPVLDLDEALVHEQVVARRLVVEQPVGEQVMRTLASPVRLSDTPASLRREAPAFGAHTDEVLHEAGFGEAQVARLREAGVVQ
jgi:crotonobetainyl-CoA:carnitine CoA-transferase CaiB-like acyl-CoA transferase